ncbi:Fc.00g064960.m01.CDS01 [Cosmosporella sp. VM-42]
MTSTFTVPPAALHDPDHNTSPHHPFSTNNQHRPSTTSLDSTHLSPVLSRVNSESLSPALNLETPSSHYQSSDFSELDEDPFFGVDFNNIDGDTPSFLDDHTTGLNQDFFTATPSSGTGPSYNDDGNIYPLTPDQTASIHTTSPRSDLRGAIKRSISERLPNSISPQELQKPFKPSPIVTQAAQLTPSHSSSCQSSEDELAPAIVAMSCQSPRVTVSMWGKDNDEPIHTIERTFEDSPTTVRGGFQSAGDLMSSNNDPSPTSAPRDSMGKWQRDLTTGHSGLDPDSRPSDEITSINETVSRRKIEDRNTEVDKWLSNKFTDLAVVPQDVPPHEINALDQPRDAVDDNIPLGDKTENRYIPGQTYYDPRGIEMSQEDYDLIAMNAKWADGPILHEIRGTGRHQPQSSQDAIARFERMCRDTDSIVSRAATWGTRRRSLPSIADFDMTSGNFLKKLSMSRGDKGNKPGGLLKDLRGLVRRPSAAALLKRSRSNAHDEESLPGSDGRNSQDRGSQDSKRGSLAPPARMSSWGKKRETPSINTALVSMGHNFASVGTTHARSGSISATPVTSPKSPFGGLTVKGSLRRPRSKSDLPKATPVTMNTESHPTLVSMWKQTGGPPVASLAKTNNADLDDEEDDDEELYEDNDMKTNSNIIDGITPNFSGFQQHVLTLNPTLGNTSGYLVDRIAHQQIIRYKQLLSSKVKHLGLGAHCPCGTLCIAMGGSASVLEQNGDDRELDPLSTKFPDEEDGSPTEGAITNESFPQDIPMPPTQRLPAEFECQLCYQSKKFQKPSDWTKHVHEDVQPFTCTWDKCRDPKIFKRKADWVRHENEGHRHLEWWTCDVEDCRHTCYRRDNFLQHLVREHKFLEPKVKTKAAMKKAGGIDPTWQKVEQCHVETSKRPQEEPCRFCGKVFPTWKKLTVHLAKHMEQISLPVLRLVAAKAKELDADTIISPVQDPPPRQIFPPVNQTSPIMQYPAGASHQVSPNPQQVPYQNHGQLMYPVMPTDQFQQPNFYQPQYESIGQNLQQNLQQPNMGMHPLNQGYDQSRQMQNIPVTTAAYVQASHHYMAMPNNGMEPFPQLSGLGLQNHTVPMGGQMGYDGIMDPSSGNASPFSGQGSMSPYTSSPNQNVGNADTMWDEKRMSGYQ